ncbi:leucine-rich repeat protein [Artemisia annua]|uniref:Leucine-rich repeat protein n=1 Tax=Artemisia annua TaxID=35608 RepID=A0A2U1MV12_ARTAN|nr:leucine-rich repeat protein [Artemisia annua]
MVNHWSLLVLLVLNIYFVSNIHTCLCAPNISAAVCSKQERLALLKFKHSVYDDAYGMLSSWVGNDCCEWERVHCDKVTGKVESLHLGASENSYGITESLVGNKVSSSLRHLRNLKFLDLSANDFQGSRIPEFIGSLKQLSYLNLSNAYFSGAIPPHIGNLSNLKVLDLGSSPYVYNPYNPLISFDMSWISGLLSLEYLDLSNINLSKAQNRDMVLYLMPSLEMLSLSGCSLTNADLGTLSNSSTTLANIKHLDLGRNHFKGQFPAFFQNMTSLEFLDLSNFNFSLSRNSTNFLSTIHYVPKMLLSSCGLHNMHLSPNHLNFTTVSIIQHLDLSRNLIEGRFPSVLTNMSALLSLSLARNMLNSWVPIMPNLLRLDLSRNNFENIEDVGIWRQCHLKELTVYYNYFRIEMTDSPENVSECSQYAFERLKLVGSLKGAFPADSLGRMANLRGLSLSGNNLTGQIPESLGRLRLLEELDLSDNHLNGSIPEAFGILTALTYLDLSVNLLNGTIAVSIGQLTKLQYLYLFYNRLTGSIPESIGQLTKLIKLDITGNSVEGVITEAHFAKLSMLKYVFTGSNSKLAFIVSREWKPPFQLISADLSSCKIINGFPLWLRTQRKLKLLGLSNASITGPLPTWLRKMPVIDVLDLSHNKLSGPLTNLPNEGSAYVSERKLNGMVMGSSSIFDSIDFRYEELVWSEENLIQVMKGVSLEYTTTFKYVINMDLSSNNLVGEIPVELMSLSALLGLNLSNNHLTGGIPDSIGNMEALISLDFSGNQLTGPIPPSIAALNFLSYLNLSHNNLSGRIPTGNQLQTLTDPSIYVGNKDLFGAPLTKNCSNNEDQKAMHKNNYKVANLKSNKVWFYMDIMSGFAAGFWGVIGVLLFKKHWRRKLFMFAEATMNKIYVAVVLRVDKMKRGRESA